jgi:hypothetical protein
MSKPFYIVGVPFHSSSSIVGLTVSDPLLLFELTFLQIGIRLQWEP